MPFTIRLCGTQGDGVDTGGDILTSTLHGVGWWVYSYRNFSSRIRGGYASFDLTISDSPVASKGDHSDVLVFMSDDAWRRDKTQIDGARLVLADDSLDLPHDAPIIKLPFTRTAREVGDESYRWIVALGALAPLLGIEEHQVAAQVKTSLGVKSLDVITGNLEALKRGFMLSPLSYALTLAPANRDHGERRLVSGAQAVAEAALAAGCDFTAAYPISPATGVFERLSMHLPPHRAVQTEDEIAAIDMAIGAAYAGATALVATSGPGLSLMMEGIGLAFATETPLVVVDGQRTGPSTGMPTKHEQSDLLLALAGGHGDVLAPVLCPASVEDIFRDLPTAFALAKTYRLPVLFMTDLAMMMSRTSIAAPPAKTTHQLTPLPRRPLPGDDGAMFHSSGNQLGVNGLPTEIASQRELQFAARLASLPMELENSYTLRQGGKELLVVGLGTTCGAIDAALAHFGARVSALFPRVLKPFPVDALNALMPQYAKILVFDVNATGQLLNLLKTHVPLHDRYVSRLKFDGEPFLPTEIIATIREVLGNA